jgi:hypothetical protein
MCYPSVPLEGLWKTTKSLRIVGVPAEIRKWQLPNARQKLYRWSQLRYEVSVAGED